MNETDLLHAFMRAAHLALPDEVRLFRRNIINVRSIHGTQVRNGIKGQCDAYAVQRGGRHIEIEAKSATGRIEAEQAKWRALCERFAIPYLLLVARSGEDSKVTVDRWVEEFKACLTK